MDDMTTLKRIAFVGGVIVLVCGLSFGRVEAKEPTSPYDVEIKPLTTAECAQCHFSIFQNIKKEGGRHQINCIRCHTQYHVYNPRKQNYDEIMPKCASCHLSATGGPFHGENKELTSCLTCHIDPHKPKAIPMSAIETACAPCHTKVGNEINKYPSRHTSDVTCADCHAEKHGYIPECSVCHESHSPEVEMATADCMVCHPVHKPTQITYDEETASLICAGCHDVAYNLLQKKETKHTTVKCVACHPATHKNILSCTKCHGEPHSKDMMMDTTKCGGCHGIAHDLL